MIWKKIRYLVFCLALLCGTYGFFHYVLVPVVVEGTSMQPTLQPNNVGLMNALDREPQRFDIVIAVSKQDPNSSWIKRCIALPNETIEYKDGVLYIDGSTIDQPFLADGYDRCDDFGPITLGEDEYFLMGDHRDASIDSRYFGAFKQSEIKGTLLFSLGI